MTPDIKYRSAISYGLWIPVSLVLAVPTVMAAIDRQLIPMIILCAAIFGIVLPIFLNTNYTITATTLKYARAGWPVSASR
ncbi:hypothetical protein [Mucilaginibacter myungsuensis]|uniref:Uncharacterized protein n=1 Tax=Mucilaginibacter myungsuensis TaxID=649104 RepID=A0A929PVV5_9SPHI|nr:hypothetical protein [Mucilaginibacter myungsuensis]MBE9662178.1 hypothetical protein [Mucilaginibacter myungsuensis]MDN3599388.1 hypothetical protein [Mucilaginibacter myungsuensis]